MNYSPIGNTLRGVPNGLSRNATLERHGGRYLQMPRKAIPAGFSAKSQQILSRTPTADN